MNKSMIDNIIIIILVFIISFYSTNMEKPYPDFIYNAMFEPLFKFIFLCIIIYATSHNTTIGILLAILFVFCNNDLSILNNLSEGFNNGPPVNTCSIYDPLKTKQIGTAFYPINPDY